MKPGIYTSTELSNEDYHRHESISKSGLDLISRSPAHFFYAARREPTRATQIGTAIHAAILEPEKFAREYMLLRNVTDRRASEYKQAVATWGADNVLTGTEADKVAGMQESCRNNTAAREYFSEPYRTELSVIATDPETGVIVRCRFDLLTESGRALDLKKTQDVRGSEFMRSVHNYRYHVQAAFYSDVWLWATGEPLQSFDFLAVEENMPHPSRVFTLDDEAIEIGRALYRKDLNLYAKCLDAGEWPGIDCEPELLSLPSWAVSSFEDSQEVNFEEVE
jgi:hypothetical protein